MNRRRIDRVTAGFVILVVLVIALMLSNSLRRSSRITLPEETETTGQTAGDTVTGGDALTVVEVTPDTVQAAIATLSRPETYSRTVRVDQIWSGGSGSFETHVYVNGAWTRTDRALTDSRTRHTITDGTTAWIWYDGESQVYQGAAGGISADNEQSIPTYEDILDLPVERIQTADYRETSDVNCIYVETTADEEDYTMRYWVSVDTGLLVAAEKLLAGETVYRMAALTVDLTAPTAAEFTLPDGTALLE